MSKTTFIDGIQDHLCTRPAQKIYTHIYTYIFPEFIIVKTVTIMKVKDYGCVLC
uniref:Uncharacterized protein n=1 Tax=Anguilla anguilla TaxID=7936 RepID=A0A0E9WHI6_ANGAN